MADRKIDHTLLKAIALIEAGADRLRASAGIAIVNGAEWRQAPQPAL
ncbi:MAG: hypothetical protein K6E38_06145 [Fretibacterium sp.]|nr:hypothetical protein [Fretibacterium sp.]